MPPWHGGGEMIVSVTYEHGTLKQRRTNSKRERRTSRARSVLARPFGLHRKVGRQEIFCAFDSEKPAASAIERLGCATRLRILGPVGQRGAWCRSRRSGRTRTISRPTRTNTGLALRGGHHCNQPLMKLGVESTARASFYFYNTRAEVDRMLDILAEAYRFFSR